MGLFSFFKYFFLCTPIHLSSFGYWFELVIFPSGPWTIVFLMKLPKFNGGGYITTPLCKFNTWTLTTQVVKKEEKPKSNTLLTTQGLAGSGWHHLPCALGALCRDTNEHQGKSDGISNPHFKVIWKSTICCVVVHRPLEQGNLEEKIPGTPRGQLRF